MSWTRVRWRWSVLLMVLGALPGCSGDSGQGIRVGVRGSPVSIQQGGTGHVDFTLSRNLYAATAQLTFPSDAPQGVNAAVVSLDPNVASGELVIVVDPSAPLGTYPATVRVKDSKGGFGSSLFTLVIAPVGGGLTLTFDPEEAAVAPGASASSILSIRRDGGFTGQYTLALHPLPDAISHANLSVTDFPRSEDDASTSLFLLAGGTAAPGRYLITAGATATGLAEQLGSFFVDVVQPGGQFALVVTEAATSIPQGGSGNASLRVARISGYAEAIAVSVEGLPVGVTATVTPPSIAPANETAVVAFTAASNAPTGTYPLTIRASGPNSSDQTAPLSLTVLANAFTVAVAPDSLVVAAGADGSAQVTLNRMGFTDPIDLSASSASGIGGTFAPATLNNPAVSSTFTFTVPLGLAPATYLVVISASSPLAATESANLTVVVCTAPCAQVLASGVQPIELRQSGGNLFWRDRRGGVYRLPKIGGTPVAIVPASSQASNVEVDDAGVYFMLPSNESLNRCNQDGTSCVPLVVGSPATTQGNLAVDEASVYWALAGFPFVDGGYKHQTQVFRVNKLAGGSVTTVVDDFRDPAPGADTSGVYVVIDGQTLYFNDGATVKAVSKSGGSPTPVTSNSSQALGLWQDAVSLYWLVGSPGRAVGKVDKTGANPVSLQLPMSFQPDGGPFGDQLLGIDVDDAALYAVDAQRIETFDKQGGSRTVLVPDNNAEVLNGPIVVDGTSLYWFTTFDGGTIFSRVK